MKYLILILTTLMLTGCAKAANDIAPQYVSSINFQNNSCQQLRNALDGINVRASKLRGIVDNQAKYDEGKAMAAVLFTPLIFLTMDGNSQQAVEYGRLKGEFQTIKQVALNKNCPFMRNSR